MIDRRKTNSFTKLVTDDMGRHRLGKWITVLGAITLSGGFIKEATTNHLEWLDYIGYAVGMTIMYAPAKATDLIYALKGMPLPVNDAPIDDNAGGGKMIEPTPGGN
jgi:hypothetical protein